MDIGLDADEFGPRLAGPSGNSKTLPKSSVSKARFLGSGVDRLSGREVFWAGRVALGDGSISELAGTTVCWEHFGQRTTVPILRVAMPIN